METKTDYIVTPDSITIPRPEDIKITVKRPTIDELETYRLGWLKEGESKGVLGDLIKIVKALGVTGDYIRPGRHCIRSYKFSGGDNDYVLFHNSITVVCVYSLDHVEFYEWDYIFLTENGEPGKEDYTGKKVVRYTKCTEKKGELKANGRIDKIRSFSLYLPGDWELYLGPHVDLANGKIGQVKKEKLDRDRNELLENMGLIKEGK